MFDIFHQARACGPDRHGKSKKRSLLAIADNLLGDRLNKEFNRRVDVVGIFPDEGWIMRRYGAILLDQNDEGQLQHRNITLETTKTLGQATILALPTSAA